MSEPLILINPFSMPPQMVNGFVAGWERSIEPIVRAPGFRGSDLHRALDAGSEFPIVNVARWDTVEAWRQAMANAGWGHEPSTAPGGNQPRPAAGRSVQPHPAFYTVVATVPDPQAGSDAAEPAILINPFSMPAELVDGFLAGWERRIEPIRRAPGFRGTVLHRARDTEADLQLIDIARWDSVQDWQAAMANSGGGHRLAAQDTSTSDDAAIGDPGEGTPTAMIRPHPAFYTLTATAPDPQDAA